MTLMLVARQIMQQPALGPTGAERPFDYEAAHREGWTVSEAEPQDDGTPGIQLQRLDNPQAGGGEFDYDQDAWRHVVKLARRGSPLHRQALLMVDDVERVVIKLVCGSW